MRTELDELINRVEDEALRAELRTQVARLQTRRNFGLVFERHHPERVRLPEHPLRPGVVVAVKDDPESQGYEILSLDDGSAVVRQVQASDGRPLTQKELAEVVEERLPLDALVVLAGFGEPIYPGLRQIGSIERGENKPAHVVIKGENYHVLEALQFTHLGKVDCIYIDPPYNSGARDWKYDNNYVDENDAYRHSKWLAFMERRLLLAKRLLNPENSVLIVTIDEKEYLRLGLLLEQMFPNARIQMVSVTISPRGTSRENEFSRVDEFLFHVFLGQAEVSVPTGTGADTEVRWPYLRRTSMNSTRDKGRPNQFYPIYIDPNGRSGPVVDRIGEPIPLGVDRRSIPDEPGLVTLWPVNPDGIEMTWGMVPQTLRRTIDGGFARVSQSRAPNAPYVIAYATTEAQNRVATGEYLVTGHRSDGSKIVMIPGGRASKPTTAWRETSHDAGAYGTGLLRSLIPGRRFPFPKSLYAVEDTLRFVVNDKPNAMVLDFFAGSGTTAHAVARLNKQDGGRRQSITVTNNEVSVDEAAHLRREGLRPGDPDWEALGIFEYITRPRVTAAVTGRTPDDAPLTGDYKFIDEFAMSEGFEENVDFLELTYLNADDIELDRAFGGIAPLLWLRAGARGPVINECLDAAGRRKPYAWTERYGVLFNPDRWRSFVERLPATATTVFIVTDSQTTFQGIAAELPESLDVVRLYENYLTTFAINRVIG